MSYARFGADSDVYVYLGVEGFICCACDLTDDSFVCETPQAMSEHLQQHRDAGQSGPRLRVGASGGVMIFRPLLPRTADRNARADPVPFRRTSHHGRYEPTL